MPIPHRHHRIYEDPADEGKGAPERKPQGIEGGETNDRSANELEQSNADESDRPNGGQTSEAPRIHSKCCTGRQQPLPGSTAERRALHSDRPEEEESDEDGQRGGDDRSQDLPTTSRLAPLVSVRMDACRRRRLNKVERNVSSDRHGARTTPLAMTPC